MLEPNTGGERTDKKARKLGVSALVLNSETRKLRKIKMIVFLYSHQLENT